MTKQESAALNMAKFIRAQSLLLLEKLDVLDLDDEAADCERMHEQAEALYQKLSARFGTGRRIKRRKERSLRRKAYPGQLCISTVHSHA